MRLALLGCVSSAVLGLGACSSGTSGFSAGTSLGSALSAANGGDDAGTGTGSTGGAGTGTGTTTTTTTTGGAGTSTSSMNTGGSTAAMNNTGTLVRVGDAVGDLTGGLIAVTGNAVLSGATGLGPILTGTGRDLTRDGLGGLPLVGGAVESTVRAVDSGLNPVAKLTLVNQTVVGSGTAGSPQLVGVSALSNANTPGQAATVGLLNGGTATQVANLSLGGAQLLGSGSGTALVGASVLSPTQATGTAATLGVPSGATSPIGGLTPVVASATSLVGGLTGGASGAGLPALLPTGSLGLIAAGGAGGAASVGPVTAGGGLLGGLGVVLTGR
ncbi:MAG: hypothetical protein KKA30_11950 [Alphaproteobacteria bacterium]|nr:hypothetical protein [Alphaproteobacteria bacterium]MBU2309428.1 hypothetical protein [Alphaproteobacteria bacterium]